MYNTIDLAYFALVAEHGGFAAAARAGNIPKSRLSRHVAGLEASLGVRLAQRSTRRFALTRMGEQVLRHAQAMLAEAQAVQDLVNEQTHEPTGRVYLSCPPALLHASVGSVLNAFIKAWDKVELHIEATNRNVDVWQDGVDLVLRARDPQAPLPQDEIVIQLAPSEHVLAASPALLASRGALKKPADLHKLPSLGLGNSAQAYSWKLQHSDGRQVEINHRPCLVVDDMNVLVQAALDGLGCAILPRTMIAQALADGSLQLILPDWTPPANVLQLAYASRRGQRAAVRKLIEHLQASL